MRFLWVLALCAGVCAGQSNTVDGTGAGAGYAKEGSGAGAGMTTIGGWQLLSLALPQQWSNGHEGDVAINSPTYVITMPASGTGGAWTCGATGYGPYADSGAGLQQAFLDAEACRTANGGTPNILIQGQAGHNYSSSGSLTIPQSNTVLATGTIAFISTGNASLPQNQVIGAHGIQDNVATSTDIGINNPDLTGKNMYFALGPTNVSGVISGITTLSTNTTTLAAVTSTGTQCVPLADGYVAPGVAEVVDTGANQEVVTTTSAVNQSGMCGNFTMTHASGVPVTYDVGTFTLANGTVVHTSDYDDLQYMTTVESTGTTKAAMQTCSPSGTVGGAPPLCAATVIGPDHWLFRGVEFRKNPGNTGDSNILSLTESGNESLISQFPWYIDFQADWFHGDWTSLNAGANSTSGAILIGAFHWSVEDSQVSQILRPGAEGHAGGARLGSVGKLAHNWLEGGGSAFFCGGFTSPPSVAGLVPCNDMELRRNRFSFPYTWIGETDSSCGTHGTGTVPHLDAHWGCTSTSGYSLVRKNVWEIKEGQRLVVDGNIFENSDGSGGQGGVLHDLNVRNSSGTTYAGSNNYQSVISDVTESNNIWRNGCEGQEMGGSNSTLGNGGGVSFLPARIAFVNELIYGVTNTNPGCTGVNSVGIYLNSASQQWKGTILENATGTQATFTATCSIDAGNCPAAPTIGFEVFDINAGDPVSISGCTVTGFNVPTRVVSTYTVPSGVGPLAIPGTNPASLTVTYPWINAGTPGGTTDNSGTCVLTKGQGGPVNFAMQHVTFITDSVHAITSGSAPSTGPNYQINALLRDSILLGGGLFNNPLGEGTPTETFNFDVTSATIDHLVWPTRTASKYTQYGNNPFYSGAYGCAGAGCSPPTGMYFPASNAAVGFACAGCGSAVPLTLSDYHGYGLSSGSAYHNAASDGADIGANLSAIDTAQTQTVYVCGSPCGAGPFSDVATPNTGQTVPSTLFGLHWRITNPYPSVPFGSLRLWDSGTRWQQMQTGASTYSFTTLDSTLQLAKTNGLSDVLLALSGTPNFISSDASNASCEYDPPAAGSCGVPTDLAISCTNVNGLHNCDGKTDGTNQTWRNFIYNLATHISGLSTSTYQHVTAFEMWNEFTAQQGSLFASWEGTDAQLVRLYTDANCIITGRGAGCSAGAMGVAAVGILPTAIVTSPNSVMQQSPENVEFGTYLNTAGALSNLDMIAAHTYTGSPAPTAPEVLPTQYSTLNGYLATAGSSCAAIPCWSSEGSWGMNASLEPDLDLQAAFVARYYLLGWSSGFKRMYWYAWDANNVGTLWNPNGTNGCNDGGSGLGCMTKAGIAYGQAYNWMVGAVFSSPCAVLSGTVWSCTLTKNGSSYLVLWDTSQSCSGGVCSTANQPATSNWTSYQDMTSVSSPISITSNQVPVGAKPIIVQLR